MGSVVEVACCPNFEWMYFNMRESMTSVNIHKGYIKNKNSAHGPLAKQARKLFSVLGAMFLDVAWLVAQVAHKANPRFRP